MIYHLKGFIARVIDIFDPDDVSYTVPEVPNLTLYYHHIKDYAKEHHHDRSFSLPSH